jgi:DNA-binding NtrC family response regulator
MDDEDGLRKLNLQILREHGMIAEGAREGGEVLELYRAALDAGQAYDVVILDLTIRGGMGGEATFAHLRKMDPGVRAILISGYADSPVMSEWRAHGFLGAVEKPFKPDTLVAAVAGALRVSR